MNYYIQGDAAKAEQIKAAFDKKGIYNGCNLNFTKEDRLFYSCDGKVNYCSNSGGLAHIIKTHPDYKELKLPIEPKFNVGDWIVRTNGSSDIPIQVYGLKKDRYLVTNMLGSKGQLMINRQDEWRLWAISDAKDGDVLATDNGWTCIFQAFDGYVFSSYCFMDSQKWFCEFGSKAHTLDSRINGNIHPATKEQRELLFAKMREAGYTWDENKKELKKLKHYDISSFHAGMPVLVRADNVCRWNYSVFSHITGNKDWQFAVCNGVSFTQCIPFEGNEHLLGTTDMCDERFINW